MSGSAPLVHVVMASFHPDQAALERQVRSIMEQSAGNIQLTIFADGPMPMLQHIAQLAGQIPDVTYVAYPENRGPAITFLEGLAHVIEQDVQHAGQVYYAFADQDDVWLPNKLAQSIAAISTSGAGAVHTDARVVDEHLHVIAPSLARLEDRNTAPSLTELFFRNCATGMTMLLDSATAQKIAQLRHLRPNGWLHDHFAAFIAAAGKGLAFVDQPLVDYVQHGGNAVGAAGKSRAARPSAGFRDPHGKSAQYLSQGADLVASLVSQGDLAAGTQRELEQLIAMLGDKGPAAFLHAAGFWLKHRHGPRALYARLLWSKLVSR